MLLSVSIGKDKSLNFVKGAQRVGIILVLVIWSFVLLIISSYIKPVQVRLNVSLFKSFKSTSQGSESKIEFPSEYSINVLGLLLFLNGYTTCAPLLIIASTPKLASSLT